MKFLTTFNKIIQGILWLYLPIVLFYWALSLLDLSAIAPLRAVLGVIIEPFVGIIDEFFDFTFVYDTSNLSYTPLVLAGVVLLIIGIAVVTDKILDFIDNSFRNLKMQITHTTMQKEKEKEWMSFQQELDKNKTIYVMVKIVKTQEHDEYLIKNEDSAFSVGLIDSYETSIVNLAAKFSGKEYTNFDAGPDIHNFVFTDVEKCLQYIKFLNQKILEINKGTAELNTIFNCEIACSCSYSIATIDTDLSLTGKILKLCGTDEILITDTLKNKIKAINNNFSLKIEPKGLYMLNDQHIDVHKLRVS